MRKKVLTLQRDIENMSTSKKDPQPRPLPYRAAGQFGSTKEAPMLENSRGSLNFFTYVL